ncbi:MAG: Asp-tRNA(Asn)/Glu-tRNA(Gln) amidotransferase subunit GatC [Myxococcales bacterium]|nr:Asp-tRNA(Asn)/Glu-tRNA(Gln) amidotransferase subunit GatC [Myxococcales bacterium]
MKIDADEVRRIAALSRLALTGAEVERFATQLSSILDYVSKLNELPTEGVEPTSHVMPLSTPLRDDVAARPLTREAALANGPSHDEFAFIVPRVI